MNQTEAQLFAMTLAALDSADTANSAETGRIENAEPMTATCTVERSEEKVAADYQDEA